MSTVGGCFFRTFFKKYGIIFADKKEGEMKRFMVFVVAVFLVSAAVPAFAQKQQKETEENLFKIIASSVKPGQVRERNKIKNPLPKVTIFQTMADEIRQGSARARGESLRSTK